VQRRQPDGFARVNDVPQINKTILSSAQKIDLADRRTESGVRPAQQNWHAWLICTRQEHDIRQNWVGKLAGLADKLQCLRQQCHCWQTPFCVRLPNLCSALLSTHRAQLLRYYVLLI
jgi:hypothetical protein